MRRIALSLAAALLSLSPAMAQTLGCDTPEARQFDFWVGQWDVYATGSETLVAHSHIEKLYAGCAVRENWMPLKGGGGGSLNAYVPADRQWHQTWVDSSGSWVEFKGGLKDKAMIISGFWAGSANGKDAVTRMTYTQNADGSVRQFGEVSTDGEKTWAPSFDLTYRPAK
jgi:hypothetical protein